MSENSRCSKCMAHPYSSGIDNSNEKYLMSAVNWADYRWETKHRKLVREEGACFGCTRVSAITSLALMSMLGRLGVWEYGKNR